MGRGKLVFKGEKPAKKKKSKKKHSHSETTEASSSSSIPRIATATSSPTAVSSSVAPFSDGSAVASSTSANHHRVMPTIEQGQGRITTSGTVLTGHDTKLRSILRSGDAIIVVLNGQEEMRVVTMVLSDISGAISSPFSSDLKLPTRYRFVRKPRNLAKERMEMERKAASEKEEDERTAFGTYGTSKAGKESGTTEMVYRERTEHGSYRIRREEVGRDVTRSDLLDMRSKKKSDKYC